jgi:hypothetical protein
MAGLNLTTGLRVGGSYTPVNPAATPSAPRTITEQAYGIGSGNGSGPRTAALGGVSLGLLALGTMIFIWWSLPR